MSRSNFWSSSRVLSILNSQYFMNHLLESFQTYDSDCHLRVEKKNQVTLSRTYFQLNQIQFSIFFARVFCHKDKRIPKLKIKVKLIILVLIDVLFISNLANQSKRRFSIDDNNMRRRFNIFEVFSNIKNHFLISNIDFLI